ncbi:reverse transcriptase domain-containing protein [Tanacetum coccineum]
MVTKMGVEANLMAEVVAKGLCTRLEGARKRRMENNPRDNHVQQPPYKRQNIARAYTVGPSEKKENCKRVGHQTKNCRSLSAATNQRALVANQRTTATCYECGEKGHYKSNCLKLKNHNRENQTRNGKA